MRGAIKVVRPFATLRFEEADMERQFQEEQWSAEKKSALLGSVFLVFAWVLRTALKTSWDPVAYGTLVGICGFFVIPLPIMVAFDMPMRLAWVWQPWLCIAVWSYGFIQTIEMVSHNASLYLTTESMRFLQHKYLSGPFPVLIWNSVWPADDRALGNAAEPHSPRRRSLRIPYSQLCCFAHGYRYAASLDRQPYIS